MLRTVLSESMRAGIPVVLRYSRIRVLCVGRSMIERCLTVRLSSILAAVKEETLG